MIFSSDTVNSPSQHKRGMIKEIISEAEFETDMTEMTKSSNQKVENLKQTKRDDEI